MRWSASSSSASAASNERGRGAQERLGAVDVAPLHAFEAKGRLRGRRAERITALLVEIERALEMWPRFGKGAQAQERLSQRPAHLGFGVG
jgi:hypothetical protein